MPKINFDIPVSTDQKTAFTKIKKFLNAENDFKKFDSKVECAFDDKNHACQIKGSQFDAQIKAVADKDKTKVQVQIDIPMALVLFKGKIKEIVEKNIKKVFKT